MSSQKSNELINEFNSMRIGAWSERRRRRGRIGEDEPSKCKVKFAHPKMQIVAWRQLQQGVWNAKTE